MGGDTALARAGAAPGTSKTLLLTHFHPDHVSGLPDFVWSEITADRRNPLTVVGPPAGDRFVGVRRLVDRLFGNDGAFPDLHAVLVETESDAKITARRVPHGRAPTPSKWATWLSIDRVSGDSTSPVCLVSAGSTNISRHSSGATGMLIPKPPAGFEPPA